MPALLASLLVLAHGPDPVPMLLGAVVTALLLGVVAIAWGSKLKKSPAPDLRRFGQAATAFGYFILGLSAVLCLAPALASFH